jgi:pseudouridine-5'-phosphate glycosidase
MHDWAAWIDVSNEVQEAIDTGKSVLALESTIITHGMPFPQNLETALQVEQAVRDEGVTPATIAIMDGKLKVGLSQADLETLARTGQQVIKTSRRDIPFIIESGACGGTTVAATMIIAAMANIRVFATGGIGGVHRGGEHSMDVSADLQELARTDVTVVCAGPKSILDIAMTLEYLETCGVAVVGYQTNELPAFFTANSGFEVDYRLDSAVEIAAVINTKAALGLTGGMLVVNPIPAEFSMDADEIETIINQAVGEAGEHGIDGKDLTPFLLQRVQELSGGDSLKANIQLILNNASLGARIAQNIVI